MIAFLDGIEQVFDVVVWFRPCQFHSLVVRESFDTSLGTQVPFDVYEASVLRLVREVKL